MTTLLSPNRRAASNVVPHNTPNFETVSAGDDIACNTRLASDFFLAGCHGSCRRRYRAGAAVHNIACNTLPCISVSLGLPPLIADAPHHSYHAIDHQGSIGPDKGQHNTGYVK